MKQPISKSQERRFAAQRQTSQGEPQRVKKPYEPGWYWYRHTNQSGWIVVEVWNQNGLWWCAPNRHRRDDNNLIENLDGEWFGPIAKPPEN